ncbi:MAG: PIN domain-containing protein [Gammaproteobacteria bacterium]|nr:PIN domain-containing protein [Gammaproteobacteria bacterium]MYL00988.1 PIN domain-containing protein [Gammaproteobacteria bacterium]
MTVFLDTNLLVYAQSRDAKSETARQIILEGGVISVQVLNEFTSVLRRKFSMTWDELAEALDDVRTALDTIRPIDLETHSAAVELAREHGLNFYDALIVAAALEAGCDQLLTEDMQAGRRINGLAIVNPFRR